MIVNLSSGKSTIHFKFSVQERGAGKKRWLCNICQCILRIPPTLPEGEAREESVSVYQLHNEKHNRYIAKKFALNKLFAQIFLGVEDKQIIYNEFFKAFGRPGEAEAAHKGRRWVSTHIEEVRKFLEKGQWPS